MDTAVIDRPRGRDMWHVPRTKGALSGLLLVALGIWGAFIPFVGPYFDFGFTTQTWEWTANRFWLSVLPGIVAIVGGLILIFSQNRAMAALGATLATVAGVWFVVGPPLSQIWNPAAMGVPLGGNGRQALIMISFFYGLGAAMIFLGASALGRLSVVGVHDVATARRRRLGYPEPSRHARGHRRQLQPAAPASEQAVRDQAAADQAAAGRAAAGPGLDEASVYPDEPRRADTPPTGTHEPTGTSEPAGTRQPASAGGGRHSRHHWWERPH